MVTRPCIYCGKSSTVQVDPEKYARWQAGDLIQTVWPEWTPDQRELLITGTHAECWKKMFVGDDDDE